MLEKKKQFRYFAYLLTKLKNCKLTGKCRREDHLKQKSCAAVKRD